MASSASAPSASRESPLGPGTTVGGRFVVVRTIREDPLGHLLAAQDQKTGRPIALRVIGKDLIGDAKRAQVLREGCRAVAGMTHANVVTTFGVGKAPTGEYYVACEWVDGAPLSALVQRRAAEQRRLSLRGACNVIAQLADGLTRAHQKAIHGALRPSVVWVDASGQVKVGDFAVGRAVVRAAGPSALGPTEQACLAPEVKAGQEPGPRSDVFGLGALLYEMLTCRSPAEEFVAPSKVHPEASPQVDAVLMKCLAQNPAERFASPAELKAALAPLAAAAARVAPEDDFAIVPNANASGGGPPPARAPAAPPRRAEPAAPVPPAPAASGERPKVGARVSVHEPFRPSLAEAPAAPAPAAEVDLSSLLSKIAENDAPRWMVVKDRLDHGPFSGRELVQLILKGEVLGEHRLLNMDTGERKKVHKWPDFGEFVQQYQIKKRTEEHRQQLEASEKAETRSNVFKIGVAAAIVGVLLLGGLTFLLTRKAARKKAVAQADLAALYERGDIKISGTAGVLPSHGHRHGHQRGGSGGSGASYEDAMNRAVSLGDVSHGGGETQLTSSTVASVMNRHINSFFSCVGQELRRGGKLGQVQIDLAIAGSGQVLGASVRQGSTAFQGCVAAKVRSIHFPSFGAPRMGARYSFSVQ